MTTDLYVNVDGTPKRIKKLYARHPTDKYYYEDTASTDNSSNYTYFTQSGGTPTLTYNSTDQCYDLTSNSAISFWRPKTMNIPVNLPYVFECDTYIPDGMNSTGKQGLSVASDGKHRVRCGTVDSTLSADYYNSSTDVLHETTLPSTAKITNVWRTQRITVGKDSLKHEYIEEGTVLASITVNGDFRGFQPATYQDHPNSGVAMKIRNFRVKPYDGGNRILSLNKLYSKDGHLIYTT